MAIILSWLVFLFPLIPALAEVPNRLDWQPGFFTTVACMIREWIGIWVLASAMLAGFGQYNAALSCDSRALWAMGKSKHVPPCFAYSSRWNSPIVSLIFLSFSTCVIMIFQNFTVLLEVDLFLNGVSLLLEFASFLELKYSERHTPRPYVVPGGFFGAWLITTFKCIIIGGNDHSRSSGSLHICWHLYFMLFCFAVADFPLSQGLYSRTRPGLGQRKHRT